MKETRVQTAWGTEKSVPVRAKPTQKKSSSYAESSLSTRDVSDGSWTIEFFDPDYGSKLVLENLTYNKVRVVLTPTVALKYAVLGNKYASIIYNKYRYKYG